MELDQGLGCCAFLDAWHASVATCDRRKRGFGIRSHSLEGPRFGTAMDLSRGQGAPPPAGLRETNRKTRGGAGRLLTPKRNASHGGRDNTLRDGPVNKSFPSLDRTSTTMSTWGGFETDGRSKPVKHQAVGRNERDVTKQTQERRSPSARAPR